MKGKVIDEILGVSKKNSSSNLQNTQQQPSTSNMSHSQNKMNQSLALQHQNSSKSQSESNISTGVVGKVLPPTIVTATDVKTEFQKFLHNFDATNEINDNKKILNDASDEVIQECALILIKQSLLYKEDMKNYALITKSTIYDNISDIDKKLIFKKYLNDYFNTEITRCFEHGRTALTDWDYVSKLSNFICELNKHYIIDSDVIESLLCNLDLFDIYQSLEAKNEYDLCIERLSIAKEDFEKYLKAVQNKNGCAYFPHTAINNATYRIIKIYANIYVEHLIMYTDEKYVSILKNIILQSFDNEEKINTFKSQMTNQIYYEMSQEFHKDSPNWSRVTKINKLFCELYIHNFVDASILLLLLDGLQKLASNDFDEAFKEFNACVDKIAHQLKYQHSISHSIVKEKLKEKDVTEFHQFKIVLSHLDRYTIDEISDVAATIQINSMQKLDNFVQIYFNFMMTTKDDLVIFVYIAQIIDKNTKSEFDFKGKLLELIIAEFFLHARDYNTKSPEKVKSLQKLIKFIGEFYNENWIDFLQIQLCLKALAVNDFEALLQIDLFYDLLKIISIKLTSTGDGVYLKEFFITLTNRIANQKATISLKYSKILNDLRRIFQNSRHFQTNIKSFKDILNNLSDRSMKTLIEKFKIQNIHEIDDCAKDFVEICIEKSENVENFVIFLTKINDPRVENIEGEKKNFKDKICEIIKDRYGKQKLECLKIFMLVCNLYKRNLIAIDHLKFYLDEITKIPLNTALDFLEYLLPSIGVKIDSQDGQILSQIIASLPERSISENDKMRFQNILKLKEQILLNKPENLNEFKQFIVNLQNNQNFSSFATQLKPKIFANEETMKQFAQAVYSCCINDTNLIELTIKFCKCLIDNEKFKEIFSIFIQLKLISIKNDEKMKFNAVKFVANCYKIDLIDDETFKPWLSAKILNDLTYNELSELSEIIAVRNCENFSYINEFMNEKLTKMCEEIKNDLKNVEISIEGKNNDDGVE